MTRHTFTRGLSYSAIVATSERVAWNVDGVFQKRCFDASAPIVPWSWVATRSLSFLDDDDQLVLNHCRAFSYVHLLRNFEEFAPPHLAGTAAQGWHGDRARLRALFRFGEEEMKHQELFSRAESVLEESCSHAFRRYFDADKVRVTGLTQAILEHSPLARFLIVLALEWGTQRHYVDSVRGADATDTLYGSLLKAHWIEEAQHTRADLLEIAGLADAMTDDQLAASFDDLLAIGRLVEVVFAGQAQAELETLVEVRGRTFSDDEASALRRTLHDSLSAIMAGVGLAHPSFVAVARALSPAGAAKLGIA